MMNKILAASLLVLVVLFGCINVEYQHYQNSDGSAKVVEKFDMGGVLNSISAEQRASSLEAMCVNATQNDQGLQCEHDDSGVIVFTKSFAPGEAKFYKFETGGDLLTSKHKLTVTSLPRLDATNEESIALAESMGEDTEIPLTGNDAAVAAKTYESMGMNFTYTVFMPGKITYYGGGELVDESTASFNAVTFMKNMEPIVVESEEMNMVNLALILVAAIIVLFVLWKAVLKKK